MNDWRLDEGVSARDEVAHLLSYNGIPHEASAEQFRFVLTEGPCKWEVLVQCRDDWAVFYSLLPFRLSASPALSRLLDECNASLTQGAVFLKDGRAVIRTGARLFDLYAAYETLALALEYNAGVVTQLWNRLQTAGSEQ